ncbi:MAG: DUF1295 domain-containing protein [Candidatus Saccharimonadales bacterium]
MADLYWQIADWSFPLGGWLVGFIAALIFQTMMFLIATRLRRDDIVDVGWGLSFIILVWTWWPIGQASWAHYSTWIGTLVAIMVTIWGLRLSLHIFTRFLRTKKEDERYAALKAGWRNQSGWARYLRIFFAQALLASIVALPAFIILILCGSSSWPLDSDAIRVVWTMVALWAVGFMVEVIADAQLRTFLRRRTTNTTMQRGLWRYSRHPNYFGELVQWWVLGIFAAMSGPVSAVLSLLGVLVITYLIVFISGIPPAEARAASRPDWRDYKRRTSVLIPMPPRR